MSQSRLSTQFHHSYAQRSSQIVAALDALLAEELPPTYRAHIRKIRHLVYELAHDVSQEALLFPHGKSEVLNQGEKRVAHLLTQGRLTREISRELHISEATVKTHLTSIYRKLHVRNRAEAIQALLT